MLGKAIEKVIRDNHAGIKSITITSVDNIGAGYQVTDGAELFEIHFRKDTPDLQARGRDGKGGFVTLYTLPFFLPQRRAVVEYMIQQLANRRFVAYCTDRNGYVTWLVPARMAYTYSSGKRLGGDNGYEFSFTGVNTHRARYVVPVILDPFGVEGTTPGDDTGTPAGPGGDGGTAADYYVRIVPAQLSYIPTQSGNTTNLNKVVVASDGHKYLIDIDGRAIALSGPTGAREILTIDGTDASTYTIAATVPTDYAAANIVVRRDQITLYRSSNPTDVDQYNYTGGQLILSPDWPLEVGEKVTMHILDYRT